MKLGRVGQFEKIIKKMPSENQPVRVRDSADARDLWTRAHPGARQSNGFRTDERQLLLPSNQDTPYGRQQAPFSMRNVRHTAVESIMVENRPPHSDTRTRLPLVDSREIERLVFRTALAEVDTNENARLKRELRRVEGELQRALCLNRALTGEMVRNARDRALMS